MQLPTQLTFNQMLTRWSSILNPLLALLITQGRQINNIVLAKTTPLTINHKLGRMQIGWIITDSNAAANVFRTVAFNNLTLTLESDAPVTINLWVY